MVSSVEMKAPMTGIDEWHLDKKITIGIILALFFNAGSGIWYAAKLDATVSSQGARIQALEETSRQIPERLARLEEGQKYTIDIVKDIRSGIKPRKGN